MGCDIHGWVECKSQYLTHHWYGVVDIEPLIHRDYAAFGLLFGVRDHDYPPVAQHRGLPEHASTRSREESASDDYHSHSWISYQEMKDAPLFSTLEQYVWWKEADRPQWHALLTIMDTLAVLEGPEHVRLVVWFDN